MKGMGLMSCQLKTHKYQQADQEHKTHDNILDRNFSPKAPNQVWTGDEPMSVSKAVGVTWLSF